VINPGVDLRCIHLGLGWIGDGCGGLERYQHGLCLTHARTGCRVEAWLQSRVEINQPRPYQIISYASPNEKRWVKSSKLRNLIREKSPKNDAVFISHHASVSETVIPWLRDVPHVVHFHGPWADESTLEGVSRWKTWLQRRTERKAYFAADRIITLSEAFKRLIVERYGVEETMVSAIPGGIDSAAADPGVDRTEARERLGWPKDRPILLTVRRLVRRVGVDVLVDAVGQIRDRHPDLLTLIGGTGPLKGELEQRIHDNGLADHVRLLGFIPDQKLSLAYAAADYSIVPTQGLEGFGLVTIESMAAGTPSIVTPVGSLPEVVAPFCNSLLLPSLDADGIADGLNQILDGKRKVPDAKSCKQYVRENFDWSIVAPRVLGIYLQTSQ
jgi:glycosyltransferase involved in cell wall biosynthesis